MSETQLEKMELIKFACQNRKVIKMDIFRLNNQYNQLYYQIIKIRESGETVPPSLEIKLKTLELLINDPANSVKDQPKPSF